MDLTQLKTLIEDQGRVFEEFKNTNNAAQKAGETERAEFKTKMGALNARLDEISTALDAQAKQIAKARLEGAGDGDRQKSLDEFNVLRKARNGKDTPDVTMDEFAGYAKQFNAFMRRGLQEHSSDIERKTMQVGVDPDGGYLVTPDTSGRMIKKIYETSAMRSIASVQSISTDALEGLRDEQELGASDYGWVSETGARNQTGTPQMGKWRIPVHEMYAMPAATQQLLDDAGVSVENWLADKVADKFIRVENKAFIDGDGVGKPRGILSYTFATSVGDETFEFLGTGTSGGFGTAPNGSDKLIELVHKLKTAYRQGARWVMNRTTVGVVRTLKDADGNYLWLPSLSANQPSTLLGYTISEFEDMPAIAANSYSIAFGDFKASYQIVDRQGIRVLRDPYTAKPYVRFYTTRRVGGGALNFEAVKFLKFA